MGTSIAITSGKGGVGKSTICISLGMVLARAGYRVCLIDVDLGLKNLDVMMGLENRVFYDLYDAMNGKCSLNKAILRDKREENLYLLPACKSINVTNFNGNDLKLVVEELKRSFDYVLLDSPAGIESGFMHSLHCADRVILVTTLDITAIQDADRIIGLLMKENIETIQVILNRVNPRFIEKGISVRMEDALSWLSVELLGIVYEDENIAKGNNRGTPHVLDEKSLTSDCFENIRARLFGENVALPKYREKNILRKLFN